MSALSIREVLGRHTVHPFPARMAPSIALKTFSKLPHGATVLDPMAGSGTVIALARATGHRAIGFDVDPLATLIAQVWTRAINSQEVRRKAERVLCRAKKLVLQLTTGTAYPAGADVETKQFVRYWFDDYARMQLAALAIAISHVKDDSVRDVLWCAFSRQIIAKQAGVSLALDLAHSRPHKAFDRAPRKPFRYFLDAVERVLEGCIDIRQRRRGPAATVRTGDVRCLPLPDQSVDLVFTSPPYLNAIDYLRCSKFSLVWMGYSISKLRSIRHTSIGAEVASMDPASQDALTDVRLKKGISERTKGILRRYVEDTRKALMEVSRVLVPNGRAVYVVGENTIRGTYIPTGKIIERLASVAGLRLKDQQFRTLPANRRYLPPPGAGQTSMDTRMRREAVLTFQKLSPCRARAAS